MLARRPGIASVVGVDLGEVFLEKARELSCGIANLCFAHGDCRSLHFPDCHFDVVVMHTLLSHVPGPERILAEAFRVLRPGGWVSIFDGDYATTTVATRPHDPLQCCVDAAIAWVVHDKWLCQHLPALVQAAGFVNAKTRSHGYIETNNPNYMLTLVERGADFLASDAGVGIESAAALKAEARRRADAGSFFGHIGYVS